MYKMAPSLLAADFSRLGDEIKLVERAGADYIHIDVMDGHFVPDITLGPPVVKSLRSVSGIVFDVHLMISEPERYIPAIAEAGADIINFHVEACNDVRAGIRLIRGLQKRAAVTVNPATPVECVYDYLDELDMVLIMSVEPGRGGQKLMPVALKKAEALAGFAANNRLAVDIEMDGGIYLDNVADVLVAGVNVVVAGSAVFRTADPAGAVRGFLTAFDRWGG